MTEKSPRDFMRLPAGSQPQADQVLLLRRLIMQQSRPAARLGGLRKQQWTIKQDVTELTA